MEIETARKVLKGQANVLKKANGLRFTFSGLEIETRIEGTIFAPICYVYMRKGGTRGKFTEMGSFTAAKVVTVEEIQQLATEKIQRVLHIK